MQRERARDVDASLHKQGEPSVADAVANDLALRMCEKKLVTTVSGTEEERLAGD